MKSFAYWVNNMECVIIYWSRFGHGEKITGYLAEKLQEYEINTKTFKANDVDPKKTPEADLYIFSSPTEMLRIKKQMKKIMKKLDNLQGKKYGIINTHAMKKDRLKNMEKILKKKEMEKIGELEFQIDKKKSEKGEGLPENWQARVEQFVKRLEERT